MNNSGMKAWWGMGAGWRKSMGEYKRMSEIKINKDKERKWQISSKTDKEKKREDRNY